MDVVAYTGTGILSGVNHNLGVTPELKIIKSRSDSYNWIVGGSCCIREKWLYFCHQWWSVSLQHYWDGGDDSATQFSVRNGNNYSDAAGDTYVAFSSSPILDGVSKVGVYTGTGNKIDVDCGFTTGARFVLIKRAEVGAPDPLVRVGFNSRYYKR